MSPSINTLFDVFWVLLYHPRSELLLIRLAAWYHFYLFVLLLLFPPDETCLFGRPLTRGLAWRGEVDDRRRSEGCRWTRVGDRRSA